MKPLRATLILTYLFVALVCLAMGLGIWYRSLDPIWSTTLHDVRWEYDALAAFVIGFALVVVVGLYMRREWGRVFAIYLSYVVIVFLWAGPLYAVFVNGRPLGSVIGADALIMSSLALVNALALSRRQFRESYR